MKIINGACQVLYELAFVLFLVLILLAPFHGLATRHLAVVQAIDDSHAMITGDVRGLSPGSAVPLYRFNYDWELPIGRATVVTVSDATAEISVDPTKLSWPLGENGTISHAADGTCYANIGSDLGVARGDTLNIFRDRVQIGQAIVSSVTPHQSRLTIPADLGDMSGLIVSQYEFATQAVVFDNQLISTLEIALMALALIGYFAVFAIAKRSPFMVAGEKIRALPINRTVVSWIVNILGGIPFTWFLTKMPLYLLAYLGQNIYQHFTGQSIYVRPAADGFVPLVSIVIAIAYYAYLITYRRSPILAFWRLISYKNQSTVKTVSFKRGLVMWALHLVIVYVFAITLLGFLNGDIAAARAVGSPFSSLEAFSDFSKYSIWALTVVGCLIGYGYSVVSILWGRYIRNLDFTITGWLTNAFCYPLLGVVIWQMIPSFTGPDPIITAGPLQLLMLVLGFAFNLLYMLSIWNLGTMFDLMTDKGVRTSGFYSVARHPNYTLEVSMFFVSELIGLSTGIQWLAILMYFFIYWIRSEREDNFMGYSNPAYVQYREQTLYKFLPGIY